MHAIVKGFASDDVELESFAPDNPDCFFLNIRVQMGLDESPGSDSFGLFVCTPKWLAQNIWEPTWGRHMLVVREYDLAAIERCICDYAAKCIGSEWHEIAERIARNLSWEFEDYKA